MAEIYELFRGRATPEAVLAAARANEPSDEALRKRLFYSHLYIGLFHELEGKTDLARKHILLADEKYCVEGYMWNVAHVHAELLGARDTVSGR